MREGIYRIIHANGKEPAAVAYKWFMISVIALSLAPLVTKKTGGVLYLIDCVCLGIFAVDYILRWITADYRIGGTGIRPFLKYPVRFISVLDMLSMLAIVSSVFGLLSGYVRAIAVLKMFRVLRLFRYSKSIHIIIEVMNRCRRPLAAVGGLAVGYVLMSAMLVFNVEPDTFNTFFDAVYWSTVSLTTVGYGDIYPVTVVGRVVAMASSFFGIAVVALPAGIVTAEYMKTVNRETENADLNDDR